MQDETKNNPPRKSNRGGKRENAGRPYIDGEVEMFRIQRLVPKHLKKEIKIKCNVLINDLMRTLAKQ